MEKISSPEFQNNKQKIFVATLEACLKPES
jgi:hypothetical protein